MGIVDNIYVQESDDRFLGLRYFQSKDFDGEGLGREIHIRGKKIYQVTDREHEIRFDDSSEPPLLQRIYHLEPFRSSGSFLIYTSNHNVRPVLTLDDIDDDSFRWDAVKEHYPGVDLQLHLEAGEIIEVEVLKNESRDQVRKDLDSRGLTVLDDQDRIAVAHFRRLDGQKRKR